jgi:hypothetical protein
MPRKSPKASEFEDMRDAGIYPASKLVLENKLEQSICKGDKGLDT